MTEADIDFDKPGRLEKDIKGAVRKKINGLPFYTGMMEKELVAQENFTKNNVICSIAATDRSMTIGYINNRVAVPKSLLNGDRLDNDKAGRVELIIRRPAGGRLFSELVFGDGEALGKYRDKIGTLIDPCLLELCGGGNMREEKSA
ncbi:MAG: hypothetical protein HDT18_00335 [Oscillibacter sp.]|nr:hypothetical protein [Oscillibacter sp.]